MNFRVIGRISGILVSLIGLAILTCIPVAWAMGDSVSCVKGLVVAGIAPLVVGALVSILAGPFSGNLGKRDAFAIVTLGWLTASLAGALPFIFVSGFPVADAFFESMSGFTTTGSSVIDTRLVLSDGSCLVNGMDGLPRAILYWRSLTHWFGGMGIVVLSLAILPILKIGGQQLYLAEVTGPMSDQITPRIASSAKILWGVYVLFTLVQAILLMCGGMSAFDAWCHSCATISTGGFSTLPGSVGQYDNAYFDWVITVFMFLSSCNFILHFRALRGKPLIYAFDEEFRFFLLLVLSAVLFTSVSLVGTDIVTTTGRIVSDASFVESLRYGAFQVVSIVTTTGFCTADFNLWPSAVLVLLLCLMMIGGCGGSTAGGLKNSRVILLLKYGASQTRRCLFPRALSNIRMNGSRVENETIHKALSFFSIFLFLTVLCAFAVAVIEQTDLVTAAVSAVASIGNIGPGLAKVGAVETYYWMSPQSKILLSAVMLLGRLEIYTVLVLFLPSFWRR